MFQIPLLYKDHPVLVDLANRIKVDCEVFAWKHDQSQHNALFIVPRGAILNPIQVAKLVGIHDQPWSPVKLDQLQGELGHVFLDASIGLQPGLGYECTSFIQAKAGDGCSACSSGDLEAQKAIEVGHTFYLGTKYSAVLNANMVDTDQKKKPIEMGCYGIGVSRIVAAVIEGSHDQQGIIWPRSIAPYSAIVIPVFRKACERPYNKELQDKASSLIQDVPVLRKWAASGDLILDDRDQSFGFRLKDALLVGYPKVIILGDKFMTHGTIELIDRKTMEKKLTNRQNELEQWLA